MEKAHPHFRDEPDALEKVLLDNYRSMNVNGRGKLTDHSSGMVQSWNYFKNTADSKEAYIKIIKETPP